MPKLNTLYLFIFIALIAVILLPCYTIFVITPLYKGLIVSETEKIVENITSHLAHYLVDLEEIETEKLSSDFVREVAETKKLLGLMKIRVYKPDGTIAYSSEISEIGGKSDNLTNKKNKGPIERDVNELNLLESYAPLVVEGKQIGVLGIFHNLSKSRNSFGFLISRSGLIASLIAVILILLIIFLAAKINNSIIRTARAEKQAKSYSNRLEILRQIDAAILAIQTPEAIARIAIDHITGFMPCHSARVYSYDFDASKSFLLAEKTRPENSLADIEPVTDLPELDKMIQAKIIVEGPTHSQIENQAVAYTIKVPLMTGRDLVGSLEIQCDSKTPIVDDYFQMVKEISAPLAMAIQNGRLFASVDEQRLQLRTLSVRLSEMEEAERRKIAVELHDRVGQNLTALNINLNIIKSRMKAGMIDGAEVCIMDSFLLIEETTEQIRDIMSELRPPNLDDHGLMAALKWYAGKRTRRSGLQIDVIGNEQAPRPALELEVVLFRIAQEALNNIIKHAKAHAATVEIYNDGQKITMSIKDDGIGFEAKHYPGTRKKPAGLGVIAMQERISALGGSLKVESSRGQGSIIIVEVEA